MKIGHCSQCLYFKKSFDDETAGQCRRHAPQFVSLQDFGGLLQHLFPVTVGWSHGRTRMRMTGAANLLRKTPKKTQGP